MSILCSAATAAFDSSHQLISSVHYLVSAPSAYTLPPPYKILLARPPTAPYQVVLDEAGDEVQGRKRKRRKVATTGEEWEIERLRIRDRGGDDVGLSRADKETKQHHQLIRAWLSDAIGAVQEEWRGKQGDRGWSENKGIVWIDEKRQGHEIDWAALSRSNGGMEQLEDLKLNEGEGTAFASHEMLNRIVSNDFPHIRSISITTSSSTPPSGPSDGPSRSATIILPPLVSFLISDFSTWSLPTSGLAELGRAKGGWNLVVLDPPWPSSSVKRGGQYETFDPYDLHKLDLKAILGDTPSLVAVWVTNKVKFRRLIIDKLFPAWGVDSKSIAEWYWVKITSEGAPVFKFESDHRKCYEGLIIGHYNPKKIKLPAIPTDTAFLSISIGHSRKPILLDLLRPYLPLSSPPSHPNVLEFFARTVMAGSVAVGNEAIKFNVLDEEGTLGWICNSVIT